MRTWIVAVGLCLFCFIIPLQCFIIGDNSGFGIQGAVLRWQMTEKGISLIPITTEMGYVTTGLYTGKTALMVIFWTLGTAALSLTTILSLIYWNQLPRTYLRLILIGLISAGILYLASCISQYGPLFHGPAGVSLPVGILVIFIFTGCLYFFQNSLYPDEIIPPDQCK
ncbi:MAG: hypothetical protein Q7T80_14490 [Methanoregula sp.]|nr:hypothetical protein [Methanoregula sp.]